MNNWWTFIILQLLDMASTLYFLSMGLNEGNPTINFVAKYIGYTYALTLCKLLGSVIMYFWMNEYPDSCVLKLINYFLLGVVVWNSFWILESNL